LSSSFKIDRLLYINFSLHNRYYYTTKLDCVLNVSCSRIISAPVRCFSF
jgi:hypothetical protein